MSPLFILIQRVIPAISTYIACSLTAYAKYLQLAYSGAGNLRDFTYNLRVNVLLIVQVKHTHCMQPIIHIDIACNTRNMLIHCLQFDCIGRIPTTCPHGTGNVQAFTYTLPALCMHFAYTLHLNICSVRGINVTNLSHCEMVGARKSHQVHHQMLADNE